MPARPSMASLIHVFCMVILHLLAFSTPRLSWARESQFFSKTERYNGPKKASPMKEELPPANKNEEFQYEPDGSGRGYGLYGNGSENVFAGTTASPTFPKYNTGESFNTENIPSEFNEEYFTGVGYENKDLNSAAGYTDNKNYAGSKSTYNADGFPQNDQLNSYHNEVNYARNPTNYVNQGGREKYGMSDTRFLDNGRYFYDLQAEESYRNRYDPANRGNGAGGSYGSFRGGVQSFPTYDNNNEEEDGSNGYEENIPGQGYQNNQGEYVP